MKTHLNLMPQSLRRWQLVRRRLRQWSTVWCLSALVIITMAWISGGRRKSIEDKLKRLQGQYAPIKTMQSNMVQLRGELDEIRRREAVVLQLAEPRRMLTLVGCVSRATKDCGGGVSLRDFVMNREHSPRASGEGPSNVLTLQGVGVDNLCIASFAAALRSKEIFEQVQVKSTGEQSVNSNTVRSFHLECEF